MHPTEFRYQGEELDLFSHARNWKSYWSAYVRPFLGKKVLEVGAGIGANSSFLDHHAAEWVCLEPGTSMAATLAERRSMGGAETTVVHGTIHDLPPNPSFDSIIYIDVLEHIEDDSAEIAAAATRLRTDGTLVVLSPAYGWLFSPYDAAIGHHRRYSARQLQALAPPQLELIGLRQLDSVGAIASLLNKTLLKSRMPTLRQILLWDRMMVPTSRLLDVLLAYRFGRSIIAVWRRRPDGVAPGDD